MKKAITLVCISALLCTALCGCGSFKLIDIGLKGSAGNDRGSYSSGAAEITDTVKDIDISWASGLVDITYDSGSSIKLEESANEELSSDSCMVWSVEGTRLVIKFSRNNIINANGLRKTLVLTLPEALRADSITISCASADTKAASLSAKRLNISSSSGSIELGSVDSDDIELSSASGEISIAQTGKCEEAEFYSSSGRIYGTFDTVNGLDVETSSGKTEIIANVLDEADIDTSSADVSLTVKQSFRDIGVSTASGAVKLLLPEAQGFTAELDTASGDFESDLALLFKNGEYVYGNGSAELEVDTSSGNVTIGCAK